MRAAFLDRDGVINELVYYEEAGVIDSPLHERQLLLIPGAAEGVRTLCDLGLKVIVVSNQPGIAKGQYGAERLDRITDRMHILLAEEGARVHAVYYCLHHPDGRVPELTQVCDCRKPKPGLLLRAAADHGIDLRESCIVGDSITDIQAGEAAGCRTVLLGRMKCEMCRHLEDRGVKPDHIFGTLLETAQFLKDKEGVPDAALY